MGEKPNLGARARRERRAGPGAHCTPHVLARTARCAPGGDPIAATRYSGRHPRVGPSPATRRLDFS